MPDKKQVTRKLSAILSADVKGYSVLMADDEVHTIETLKAYRHIISDLVSKRSGRVVDSPGDNILAEFRSSVDAVECAVKIQKALDKENSKYVDEKKVQFRIGVNIGDVIQDGDRIYGNGVNVAARIEGLADPGGVCISKNVYNHVGNKLSLGYEYIGEHTVKNIRKPVRAYKLLMADEDAGKLIGEKPKPVTQKWIWATAVMALIMITVVVWQFYQKMTEPEFEPARVEEMAFPLPEIPSIAVLPFVNMSGDSSKEYFSDNITEQIITSLSKVPRLFVISRTSTFAYKNKPVKIQTVAEDLGIRYVLEGSIQHSGDKIRITAQLIDALTGRHIWAEQYERNYQDLFALQDDITWNIMNELQAKLTAGERYRSVFIQESKPNLKAYEKMMEGVNYLRAFNIESNETARRLSLQAIELDPEYYGPYALMAGVHIMDVWLGSSKSPSNSLDQAIELLQKSITLEENNDTAYSLLCHVYGIKRQFDKSIEAGEKAIDINPNSDQALVWLAMTLNWVGKSEEAIALYQQAIRLCPTPPAYYYLNLGHAYRTADRCEEAIKEYKKTLHLTPTNHFAFEGLSICYGLLGQEEESRAAASELMKINPKVTVNYFKKILPQKNRDLVERWADVLRKAGIPEYPPGKEPPEKPSIAVLPFDNLSDDPEQGYLADGLTDELIGDLAKIEGIFVISRNSTFTYKGKDFKIPEVAKELNVRYVLEGSVQRAGNRLRIRAQLIDGKTDHHVWAESYDGEMGDIFELQDEITGKISSALALKLSTSEQKIIADKGTTNIDAYSAYLKGMGYMRRFTPDDYVKAIGYFKQAIELDQNYSQAYAALAYTYWNTFNGGNRFVDKIGIDYETCRIFARHYLGLAMKKPTSRAYQLMAFMEQYRRHYKEAIEYAELAVTISPNDANALSDFGFFLVWNDNPEAGIEYFNKSILLDPLHRGTMGLGVAYFYMKDYEKTLKYIDIGITDNPERTPFLAFSAAAHAFLGNKIEANKALNNWLGTFGREVYPSVQFLYYCYPHKNSTVFDRLLEGLVKAGYQADLIGYYKVDEKNKLSGQEIETLIDRKTTTGYVGDFKWSISPLENGNLVMSTSINGFILSKYIGKSWIEGDSRCYQYENRYEGIKHCTDYFYNPEGEEKTKTEYIGVNDFGIHPFSVVE